MVLPIRQDVGQLVGESLRVEGAPSRAYLVISGVGPLNVGNDTPVRRGEAVFHLPQGDVVGLFERGPAQLGTEEDTMPAAWRAEGV